MQALYRLFRDKARLPEPEVDELGRIMRDQEFKDPWGVRRSLAVALAAAVPLLGAADLPDFVASLLADGLADRHEAVREQMLEVRPLCLPSRSPTKIAVALELMCARARSKQPGGPGRHEIARCRTRQHPPPPPRGVPQPARPALGRYRCRACTRAHCQRPIT